jgi:hypothetical protein
VPWGNLLDSQDRGGAPTRGPAPPVNKVQLNDAASTRIAGVIVPDKKIDLT